MGIWIWNRYPCFDYNDPINNAVNSDNDSSLPSDSNIDDFMLLHMGLHIDTNYMSSSSYDSMLWAQPITATALIDAHEESLFHKSSVLLMSNFDDLHFLTQSPHVVPDHLIILNLDKELSSSSKESLKFFLTSQVRTFGFCADNQDIRDLIAHHLTEDSSLRNLIVFLSNDITTSKALIDALRIALGHLQCLLFYDVPDTQTLSSIVEAIEHSKACQSVECICFPVSPATQLSPEASPYLYDVVIRENSNISHFSQWSARYIKKMDYLSLWDSVAHSTKQFSAIGRRISPKLKQIVFPRRMDMQHDELRLDSFFYSLLKQPAFEHLHVSLQVQSPEGVRLLLDRILKLRTPPKRLRSLNLVMPRNAKAAEQLFASLGTVFCEKTPVLQVLQIDFPADLQYDADLAQSFLKYFSNEFLFHVGKLTRLLRLLDIPVQIWSTFMKTCLTPFLRNSSQWLLGVDIMSFYGQKHYVHAYLEWEVAMALRENCTICHFNFPWTTTQARASAASTLRRNRLYRSSRGLLLYQVQHMLPPDTAKLFLCGHGGAGKTTLRRALLMNQLSLPFGQRYYQHFEKPTRGMELHTLSFPAGNSTKVKLLICDLAGQHAYHAFHHFFVSDSNSSLFLVVCKWTPTMSQEQIDSQLVYWLRFIVSHRSSISSKPRVIVIVNFFHPSDPKSALHAKAYEITRHLIEKYMDVLNFGNAENFQGSIVFGIVAIRAFTFVKKLKQRLRSSLMDLLGHRSPIPKACYIISNSILSLASKSLFLKFCNLLQLYLNHLKENESLSENEELQLEVFKAALSELHYSGDVVYFPEKPIQLEKRIETTHLSFSVLVDKELDAKDPIVVTDSNWFCNELIGELLAPKHNNGKGMYSAEWQKNDVKNILRRQCHGCTDDTTLDEIIRYLERLQLCVTISGREDHSEVILFPALLKDDRYLWPPHASLPGSKFYGRRLKCKDEEKQLIPFGIFTRLQAMLKKDQRKESCRLWNCHASFIQNGVAVVVRFGGGEVEEAWADEWGGNWKDYNWIDILFFKQQNSSAHVDYVMVDLKDKITQLCQGSRDSRAIPTVRLDEYVLKNITAGSLLMHIDDIYEHIRNHGWEIPLCWKNDFSISSIPEIGPTYVEGYLLPSEIEQLFRKQVSVVSDISLEIGVDIKNLDYQEIEEDIRSDDDSLELNEDIKKVWRLMKQLVDRRFTELTTLLEDISKDIKLLGKSLERVETNIISKCSTHLVEQLLEGPFPLYPYLSDHKNKLQRPKDLAWTSKRTYLHFLCEASFSGIAPHPVPNQPGIQVVIEHPEWVQKLLPILLPALKILCCAGKLAASVFLPGRHESPQFLGIERESLQRDSLPELMHVLLDEQLSRDFLCKGGYQLQREEVKSCLLQVLAGRDVDMWKDFKLKRVKIAQSSYSGGNGYRTPQVAWVCEEHAHWRAGHVEILRPMKNPFRET